MMEVFGRQNILQNRIAKNKLEFARKIFAIRLRGAINETKRFEKFDKIAREQLKELKTRYEAKEAGTSANFYGTERSEPDTK